MRKIFTLIAVAAMAMSSYAQSITFTVGEKPADGFTAGDLKLTYVDSNSKITVDANNCYFGDATTQVKYESRLKTGGKSDSKNNLTLHVPAAGTLKIAVRTASSGATDRNLVLTQNGTELYNAVILESTAIEVPGLDANDSEKKTKVYPYVVVSVSAGNVDITYPVGSLNFYAFEFMAAGGTNGINAVKAEAQNAVAYNLAGQKVSAQYKGVVVKNGKKVVLK